MPAFEFELSRLNAAEAYKQHQEKQNGLCSAADGLQNRSCSVYGRYLGVDEICSCTGDHTNHQHPVFKEFEKSAFHLGAKILFIYDLRFILAHQNTAKS